MAYLYYGHIVWLSICPLKRSIPVLDISSQCTTNSLATAREKPAHRLIKPFILKKVIRKLSSGCMTVLMISLKLRKILQNIQRRVVGKVLNNISPWNIFSNLYLPAGLHQNCQAAFGRCEYSWVKWKRVWFIVTFSCSSFNRKGNRCIVDVK